MDTSRIGYIICESDITLDVKPPRVIQEDTIDTYNNNGDPIKHRRLVAEGVLQTADVENRNHRIYSADELFPQLESNRTKDLLRKNMFLGEMTHPTDASLARQQTIDEKLSAVRYLKFWTEGKDVWARFKGSNTQYGDTFDLDLREGCLPEFSLRALGTLENTPKGAFVRNLRLITYDQVIYASHPTAYTRRIVSESTNVEGAIKRVQIDESTDIFEPITNKQIINYLMTESANLNTIKDWFDIKYDTIKYLPENGYVQMRNTDNDIMMVNLESYISNEINQYTKSIKNK